MTDCSEPKFSPITMYVMWMHNRQNSKGKLFNSKTDGIEWYNLMGMRAYSQHDINKSTFGKYKVKPILNR